MFSQVTRALASEGFTKTGVSTWARECEGFRHVLAFPKSYGSHALIRAISDAEVGWVVWGDEAKPEQLRWSIYQTYRSARYFEFVDGMAEDEIERVGSESSAEALIGAQFLATISSRMALADYLMTQRLSHDGWPNPINSKGRLLTAAALAVVAGDSRASALVAEAEMLYERWPESQAEIQRLRDAVNRAG